MIDILFSAFLLSVVLLGIHSYYGLHIIERGIFFTDLGIGQMAAFGAAISIWPSTASTSTRCRSPSRLPAPS